MVRNIQYRSAPLGLIWVDCPYPMAAIGLAQVLEKEARVHLGREAPTGENPSLIILSINGLETLLEDVERVREANPDIPVLIFGLHLDLPLAQAALRLGARGFIHAGMQPEQILRALKVAKRGETVAPRELLEYMLANEKPLVDLNVLSSRQREILELVCEGLTNAQIAGRLFLTESTVKQHLRSTYKVLGVRNRTEAAKLMRESA
jgi:DNA-binding NarL/FixJ family response regulator